MGKDMGGLHVIVDEDCHAIVHLFFIGCRKRSVLRATTGRGGSSLGGGDGFGGGLADGYRSAASGAPDGGT